MPDNPTSRPMGRLMRAADNQSGRVTTIAWPENGHFYAALPDFPGCIGDGPTLSEAVEDCRMAALEWLDEARRLGRMQ